MKKNEILLLVALLFLYSSCKSDKEKFTFYSDKKGIRQVFSSDGQLIIEQQITKGETGNYIVDGYSKEFYNNKSIKSESYFRNGIIDSVSIFYYPNGKISEWYYRNDGLLSGLQSGLDSLGNLQWAILSTRTDSAIFKIMFDAKSNVTSFSGTPLYLIEKPHTPQRGEIFSVANIVFQCKYIRAYLNVKLLDYKNDILFNDDVKKFDLISNNDCYFFDYKFDNPGIYYYCAELQLIDTLHHKFIKNELVKDTITVR